MIDLDNRAHPVGRAHLQKTVGAHQLAASYLERQDAVLEWHTDCRLVEILARARLHLRRKPREVSGDAGFANEANLATLQARRIVGYLAPAGELSVHSLMDRIEAIDCEVGLPFGWFFLMTRGNRVEPNVGEAIAQGLRADRIRLPDHDAKVLLRWGGSTLRLLAGK